MGDDLQYGSSHWDDACGGYVDDVTGQCFPASPYLDPIHTKINDFVRRTGQRVDYVPDTIVTDQGIFPKGIIIGGCPGGTSQVGGLCLENSGFDLTSTLVTLAKVAISAVSLGTLSGIDTAVEEVAYAAATTGQILHANEVNTMGLDLGGIFSNVSSAIGGIDSGNYLQALQGGLGVAGNIFSAAAPAPQPVSFAPVYQPPPQVYQTPPIAPVPVSQNQNAYISNVSSSPGTGIASTMAGIVSKSGLQILLAKVAAQLGRRGITLSRVVGIIRAGLRYLSPAAVAVSLGLEVAELAILLSANNARKRRRMNPANSRALRRAARRIKSFHRLCTHTDVLKGRGRRYAGSRCGTCRKSPCRC